MSMVSEKTQNPFKDYGDNLPDEERYKKTLVKLPPHLMGKALDLGIDNPFSPILEQAYPKLNIMNTTEEIDFDIDPFPNSTNSFDIIFSFEVIEHLMNPLWNLLECHRVLKDNGTIYLTTPKGVCPSTIMWSERHFHEMDSKRIHILAERAGFVITRFERFNKHPLNWLKHGIFRPTLRVLFGGWYYIEMKKM